MASERYKGSDEVIQVLHHLPPDVVYLIAGGDDQERLRNKVVEAGVADRVRFTGHFPEADKADIYTLADVYVMPSR